MLFQVRRINQKKSNFIRRVSDLFYPPIQHKTSEYIIPFSNKNRPLLDGICFPFLTDVPPQPPLYRWWDRFSNVGIATLLSRAESIITGAPAPQPESCEKRMSKNINN